MESYLDPSDYEHIMGECLDRDCGVIFSVEGNKEMRIAAQLLDGDILEVKKINFAPGTATIEKNQTHYRRVEDFLTFLDNEFIGVTIRLPYSKIRTKRVMLEDFCAKGLIDNIIVVDDLNKIEEGNILSRLCRHHPEFVKRISLEVDILKYDPLFLDEFLKPILPDETRNVSQESSKDRMRSIPSVYLVVGERGLLRVFHHEFSNLIEKWKAELPSLSNHARIIFDINAFNVIRPDRTSNLMRAKNGKNKIFGIMGNFI